MAKWLDSLATEPTLFHWSAQDSKEAHNASYELETSPHFGPVLPQQPRQPRQAVARPARRWRSLSYLCLWGRFGRRSVAERNERRTSVSCVSRDGWFPGLPALMKTVLPGLVGIQRSRESTRGERRPALGHVLSWREQRYECNGTLIE